MNPFNKFENIVIYDLFMEKNQTGLAGILKILWDGGQFCETAGPRDGFRVFEVTYQGE